MVGNQCLNVLCRRQGLPWLSAVDDLTSVRKALAAGLFSHAAQYISTAVESRDKELTGVDQYQLVRSTSQGKFFYGPITDMLLIK